MLCLMTFMTSLITVYAVYKIRRPELLARDVFKPKPIYIPKIGGVCLVTASIPPLTYSAIKGDLTILSIFLTIMTAGILGLIDDLRGLPVTIRVLIPGLAGLIALTCVKCIRILFLGSIYDPFLLAIICFAYVTVIANAVNMLDVMNGIVPASAIIVVTAITAVNFVRGDIANVERGLLLLSAFVPLLIFNMYPARVFNGNVGSYAIGAGLAVYALIAHYATELLIALMPFIINGALIVISARGFKPRETLKRPVFVVNGVIYASKERGAPYTLVRLLVSLRPMSEKEVVIRVIALVAISTIISALTSLFT